MSPDSLGAALLEFESLAGVGLVQRGEGAGLGRVWLAAVGGQHAGDVAGTGVERRGSHRGGVEGPVQGLQEGHGFVARRDVLGRLRTRRTQRVSFTGLRLLLPLCSFSPSVPPSLTSGR